MIKHRRKKERTHHLNMNKNMHCPHSALSVHVRDNKQKPNKYIILIFSSTRGGDVFSCPHKLCPHDAFDAHIHTLSDAP